MTVPPIPWKVATDTIKVGVSLLEHDVVIPVAEMPDAAATVRDIERRLADLRHGWNTEQIAAARDPESEVGPPTFEPTPFGVQRVEVKGTEYKTVTTRSAKRTYNTAAIIHGIAKALGGSQEPVSPTEALLWAVRRGVAAVEWKWKRLQETARELDLPMRVVLHPISDDGDLAGPWVGEKWTERIGQKAVMDEGSDE